MAIDVIKSPPLSPELKSKSLMNLLKFFGPGAVMASLTIGSGETFFASRGGAVFSYAIIWAFVLGCFFKWVQCYTAMRYLTLTGDHPLRTWSHFPGPRGWFPFLMAVLSIMCFPFWMSFLPSLLGTLCHWMFKFGDHLVWGTIWVIVGIVLTVMGGYGILEKVQLVIVGLLIVAIIFSVFYFGPDWGAVATGAVIPRIPDYAPWILEKYPAVAARPPWVEVVTYVGAIGGGTYDYIGYVGLLREKNWGVLGLPDEFVQIFIKTAIRRENGATELLNVRSKFDNIQIVVTMLVMTFLMPCINATIVVFKERGVKTALIILGTVITWAVIVGATFNFVCRALGFTFT